MTRQVSLINLCHADVTHIKRVAVPTLLPRETVDIYFVLTIAMRLFLTGLPVVLVFHIFLVVVVVVFYTAFSFLCVTTRCLSLRIPAFLRLLLLLLRLL